MAGRDAGQWIVRAGCPVDPPRLRPRPRRGAASG